MEPIAERIYQFFFKHKGYKNDSVIAKELGYSHPEKISRLFRDKATAKPSVDILEDITKKFGSEVNLEWLITGNGDMLKPTVSNDHSGAPADPFKIKLSATINREISLIRLSLEKLEKAASEHLDLGRVGSQAVQQIDLDKNSRATQVSKKGTRKDKL
jgi:hypothetical protein